jgi:hypothetical protein
MNRVLNKGFASEPSLNSALISFSDVFHPASRMQSCHVRESKGPDQTSFAIFFYLVHASSASRAGVSMRSSNAC